MPAKEAAQISGTDQYNSMNIKSGKRKVPALSAFLHMITRVISLSTVCFYTDAHFAFSNSSSRSSLVMEPDWLYMTSPFLLRMTVCGSRDGDAPTRL